MWPEIEKNLAAFETGVLNATDAGGHPYSVRCRPRQDPSAGVLRLDLGGEEEIRPGDASLLFHSHDEELWNQKVFLLLGKLEGAGDGLIFRPERPVGGMGLRSAARMLIGARRTAAAYLKKRGLQRPRIPWNEIEAVKEDSTE
ncbi:MAG TPA: hypothetical protein VKA73_17540 [Rubrobacter sp.]|nr:hypothetical protein [Rubrobacter sp.]